MKKLSLKLAASLLIVAPALSFGGGRLVIRVKPPRARVEVRTRAPGPNHIWISGRWTWSKGKYVWVSGAWVKRPAPKAVWVSGHWTKKHGNWIWVAGHWNLI